MAAVPDLGRYVAVREYGPADFETVYAIDCAAFEEGRRMSREKLRHHLGTPNTRALVAEERGTVVAYALACVKAQGLGYLKVLAVVPGLQSRGIGSRLMADIEAWLWESGAGAIMLETANDETSARDFYERHGYFVLEVLDRFYEDGTGAFRMMKDPEM
ncbi:MAG TPA: GNAT family N-acetyltransferase [Thermoanaerobaculia bacterium]|nr:GNAT family N-acetyltransferase [Thermoanaerobaculia bacterium]